MKMTILYDNEKCREDLDADWGFACLVEVQGLKILFDTGADGPVLLENMNKLDIDPGTVDEVFISHVHFDHTGGLFDFLNVCSANVYIPSCISVPEFHGEFATIRDPVEIHPDIFSTGELDGFEQSLVVRIKDGLAVIVGCSHPGVEPILKRASRWGQVKALLGGFHGFDEFHLLKDLAVICPAHCTLYKKEIKGAFPAKTIEGGVGRVIEIEDWDTTPGTGVK
ncbi:MAG: MBL fold metallo-hydrolase [Desulfatiglandales bacterium]